MTDLIERLRSCARWGTMTSEFVASDRIEWIAADEIERLRRELTEARGLLVMTRLFIGPADHDCGDPDCEMESEAGKLAWRFEAWYFVEAATRSTAWLVGIERTTPLKPFT